MIVDPLQLKAYLLDGKLLTKEQFKKVEKEAGKDRQKFAEILVKEKLISQEQLNKLQAYILGIPFVNLAKEKIPKEILQIIPEPIARSHKIIASKKILALFSRTEFIREYISII